MLRNYLTIALRTLRRNAGATLINVVGLAVAMATCLLIWLYVQEELSYDDFHPNATRIHAVTVDFGGSDSRRTPKALGSLLATKVSGVQEAVQIGGGTRELPVYRIDQEKETRSHQDVLRADSTFFDVFEGFTLTRGDPTAFGDPGQVVVSESLVQTFFNGNNPIGEPLIVDGNSEQKYTVAGVAEVPANSTIQFDILVPSTQNTLNQPWKLFGFFTYVEAAPGTDFDHLTETVVTAAPAEVSEKIEAVRSRPLPEIYLSDLHSADSFRGQVQYLYLFGTVALLILLIAGINYVNLVTAQASRRAHEVGVRKTVGAQRRQLAGQFLLEIGLLSGVSLLGAIGLAEAVLPAFNALFNTSLTLTTTRHATALLAGALFVFAITLLAGVYPAAVLSNFAPTQVLRGRSIAGGGSTWVRKGLVVAQFAASAGLILGTLVVYQQIDFLQDKELGFDDERVVTVSLSEVSGSDHKPLLREARRHPALVQSTISGGIPGRFFGRISKAPTTFSPTATSSKDPVPLHVAKADTNYVETLGLTLLRGRTFSESSGGGEHEYVLNKAAVRALGWTVEEAVGKSFSLGLGKAKGRVIGVVDNYHIESLHNPLVPVALHTSGPAFGQSERLIARLAPDRIQEGLNHLNDVVSAVAPEQAFRYTFLDDRFNRMYESEERLAQIFSGFALIAVVIACMGLFGLSSFAVQRRTKEIGIRKALGATATRIVRLLSKEYAVLVGIAFCVGTPFAYLWTHRWLQDFAFRVDVGLGAVLGTGTLLLCIAGGTVSYHALRAARTDPAITLRDE